MPAQGGASSQPLMVVCSTCGDAIPGDGACPTCGELEPRTAHADPTARLDEALLYQVGVTLAEEAALARRPAAELNSDRVVLRGRLRTQAVLLRRLLLERPRMQPAVTAALGRVETVLRHTAGERAAGHWTVSVQLPRDATCGTVARRLLAPYVREHLDPVAADDALFVASELATNAFLHGTGTITLQAERWPDRLRIEVGDEGGPTRIETPSEADPGERGRGLLLVERMATAWGTEGNGLVWAEMAFAPAERAYDRRTGHHAARP
jgi:anti-sigma regulatory factor (Ser/Thr protein kinase)